jgi:hypothetical protein
MELGRDITDIFPIQPPFAIYQNVEDDELLLVRVIAALLDSSAIAFAVDDCGDIRKLIAEPSLSFHCRFCELRRS